MSTAAVGRREPASFYQATIGKKVVMAATGIILLGYVVGHLLGNLQLYLGPERLDAYGAFLHRTLPLLWGTRLVLLVAVGLHVIAAVQLAWLKRSARPIGYARYGTVQASWASRTMFWTGVLIAGFVVYHILNLTTGTVHPGFAAGRVYDNVVAALRVVPSAAFYVVALVGLGLHLSHGLWSMFQSLGVGRADTRPAIERFALGAAVLIAIGYITIPLAVLTGIVGQGR